MLKKSISAVLTLVLLFSVCVPAFATGRENLPHYEKMLVIGDSVTCAYGLPTCESFGVAEGSYADIVAKEVGASPYTSLAFTGCCIAQISGVLGLAVEDEDVEMIQDFLINTPGSTRWEEYEKIKNGESPVGDVKEAIQSSDLIMIAIGANDIGVMPFNRALWHYNHALANGASQPEAVQLLVEKFIETMNMGLDYFLNGYPEILGKIRELNPDADIVLVGSYNPFMKVNLTDKDMLAIGSALSPAIKLQNEQIKRLAMQYDCIYADVFDLSYRFNEMPLEEALENKPLDTHPDYDGHAWMAEQILDAIAAAQEGEADPTAPNILCGIFAVRDWLHTVFDFVRNFFASLMFC